MGNIDAATSRVTNGMGDLSSPYVFERYTYEAFTKYADKPLEWLVEGLIPRVGVTLLVGDAMVGKSRFVNALIAARSRPKDGDHLAGLKVRPGRTALLSLEHAPQSIARGLKAARLGRGLASLNLVIYRNRPPIDLTDPMRVAALLEQLVDDEVDLIVFDSLRRVGGFNENHSDEVNAVMTTLNSFVDDHRAVLLLHHLAKGSNTPRGSGDLTASSDSVLKMSRNEGGILTINAEPHDAEPCQVVLRPSHVGDQMTFVPVEEGEQEETLQGAVLEFVGASPQSSGRAIRDAVTGDNKAIGRAVFELERMGAITNVGTRAKPLWTRA